MERSIYSQPGSRDSDRECYRLTAKGRDLCRRELSLSTYNAQNPAHDLTIADRYFSLSVTERETWQTETQCRDLLAEHIQQLRNQGDEDRVAEIWDKLKEGAISMPDAIYTSDSGVVVAYEVVTGNYGQEDIEAKEEAAETLGAIIEFERV